MQDGHELVWSRSGQFSLSKAGHLVELNGLDVSDQLFLLCLDAGGSDGVEEGVARAAKRYRERVGVVVPRLLLRPLSPAHWRAVNQHGKHV